MEMEKPPEASGRAGYAPPRRLRRKRRPARRRRSLFAEVWVQVFSVVLGILLAVGVDHWRQAVKDKQVAAESIQAIRREMTGNQTQMQGAVQYQAALMESLDKILQGHSRDKTMTLEEFRAVWHTAAPHGLGIRVPRHIAWDTAVAAQAPGLMDYKTRSLLSGVYQSQQLIEDQQMHMAQAFMTPENLTPSRLYYTLVVIEANLEDIRASEAGTLDLYGAALERVRGK